MTLIDVNFWSGKRVFLTGHTGFKGSWLSIWLKELGVELHGYALAPPTKPSLYEQAGVGEGITSNIGDIRDLDHLHRALERCDPEIVIHMAAQPLVRYSYSEPIETYSTNVMGTVHVLEAIRRVGGVRAIVNVTSDKCYENRESIWGYREYDAMGGYDPYSSSKGCSELITSAYSQSFFLGTKTALASARAGNVIGGGDWSPDRLVPDLLRSFEKISLPIFEIRYQLGLGNMCSSPCRDTLFWHKVYMRARATLLEVGILGQKRKMRAQYAG
jgi:CDP-glucose 4,6-dehydratase